LNKNLKLKAYFVYRYFIYIYEGGGGLWDTFVVVPMGYTVAKKTLENFDRPAIEIGFRVTSNATYQGYLY
jgi:hypothetical protein